MARIEWKKPSAEAFKKAEDDAQVIVLYFGDREDSDVYFNDVNVDGLVLAGAVTCFRVEESDAENEKSASRVPASKLNSENLWDAYGVEKADTYVVTDRYGNAMEITQDCALKTFATDISKHFRGLRKDLRKLTKAADKSNDNGDVQDAIAKLHEGFELGLVGYRESDKASELYADIMDAARAKVSDSAEDMKALKQLGETYADTNVAKEIDAAIKKCEKASG